MAWARSGILAFDVACPRGLRIALRMGQARRVHPNAKRQTEVGVNADPPIPVHAHFTSISARNRPKYRPKITTTIPARPLDMVGCECATKCGPAPDQEHTVDRPSKARRSHSVPACSASCLHIRDADTALIGQIRRHDW
jgi:hypothetical protein